MAITTPRRIKGATVETEVFGRPVTVVFKSPYRWRIYDGNKDITADFGHALRGPSLPPHSKEWLAFHKETKANERNVALDCVS